MVSKAFLAVAVAFAAEVLTDSAVAVGAPSGAKADKYAIPLLIQGCNRKYETDWVRTGVSQSSISVGYCKPKARGKGQPIEERDYDVPLRH